jgi:hypothetical protein
MESRQPQGLLDRPAQTPVMKAPKDLPDHVRPAPAIPGKDLPLAQPRKAWPLVFADEYLTDLFRRHGGNISQDAKTAGIFDRKTLRRLLAKHGIRA